jgi:hypothetical protein
VLAFFQKARPQNAAVSSVARYASSADTAPPSEVYQHHATASRMTESTALLVPLEQKLGKRQRLLVAKSRPAGWKFERIRAT